MDFHNEKKCRGGAGGGGFSTSVNLKQNFWRKTDVKTTFKDVAGLEGAKKNTRNCRILKNPEKYTNLGVKFQREPYL
jgi:cell division protease FtsH